MGGVEYDPGLFHAETGVDAHMALGYDGKLYILAFDHRGSFQKKMFGIEGDPTPEETDTISDAKRLIYEGMQLATERDGGVAISSTDCSSSGLTSPSPS